MTTRRSDSRNQGGRVAVTACALAIALVGPRANAEDGAITPAAPVRPVVIGQEYQAGGVHRWLWGDDYRALWTTATRVEPLDLHTVAGGLTPKSDHVCNDWMKWLRRMIDDLGGAPGKRCTAVTSGSDVRVPAQAGCGADHDVE